MLNYMLFDVNYNNSDIRQWFFRKDRQRQKRVDFSIEQGAEKEEEDQSTGEISDEEIYSREQPEAEAANDPLTESSGETFRNARSVEALNYRHNTSALSADVL